MIPILQQQEKTLRTPAREVSLDDIDTKKLNKSLEAMSQALREQDDGVAIAAPQIGISERIFLISGRFFDESLAKRRGPAPAAWTDHVFINPKIIKKSKDKKSMEEGCLSVRWLYGRVKRASRATVEAYDEHGKKKIVDGSGLLAQIFQHEIDHLDGILFIDTATNIKEVPPEGSM